MKRKDLKFCYTNKGLHYILQKIHFTIDSKQSSR